MAYRSLPKFDPSARFLVTARLPVLNGVPMKPGEAMPIPPAEPGPARVYVRLLRQLYELRKITMAEPSASLQSKQRKEKTTHGRAKVQG
jgi:hypothetical protein